MVMIKSNNKESKPGARIWKSTLSTEKQLKFIEQWPSVGHLLIHRLTNEHADKTVMTDHASGRTWTGRRLADKILDVAAALVDRHDFRQGDHLCVIYKNSDTSAIFTLAAIVAGGFVSAGHKKDSYEELLRLARLSRPRFVLCSSDKLDWLENVADELNYQVIGLAVGTEMFDQIFNYDHRKSAKPASRLPVECSDKQTALEAITMSSGTTGKPKPVARTQYMSLFELGGPQVTISPGSSNESPSSGPAPSTAGVIMTSFNHASGRMFLMSAVASGHNAIMMDDFDALAYLEIVEKYKLQMITMGVAYFYQLITHPDAHKYDLSSVRSVFVYGASVSYMAEMGKFLDRHRHITHLKQLYGTSEALTIAIVPNPTVESFLNDPGACGHLAPGVEMKLIDPESGEPILEFGKAGLAMVKSPTLFCGYYNVELPDKLQRDETIFDADGFYHTGDLCFFDEHDGLHFIGRHQETIICRQVSKHHPIFFEELLQEHPAVKSACVMGIDSKLEQGIQCPRAYIGIRPEFDWHSLGSKVSPPDVSIDGEPLLFKGRSQVCSLSEGPRHSLAREILHWANGRLSWVKQLRGGICLLDEMPMARAIGKIDKFRLRSLTLDQIEIYGDLSE